MERNIVAGAISTIEGLDAIAVRQPAAGSHTWKLRMQASAGTITMTAGSFDPAFILVEDIGV